MPTSSLRHRRHQRWYPEGSSIWWSPGMPDRLRRGALRDASDAGVGIQVEEASAPGPGSVITVFDQLSGTLRRARVVRRGAAHEGRVLLGCRFISATPRRTMRPAGPGAPRRRANRIPVRHGGQS